MVSLILYPNKRINKTLFFQSIAYSCKYLEKPVYLTIADVDVETFEDDMEAAITIFYEIRQYGFECKAYAINDGVIDKSNIEVVPATNEVVKIPYIIGYDGKYFVENDNELFCILNYAFQKKNRIWKGNVQGLKDIKYGELFNALKGLSFKAICVENDKGQLNIVPKKEFEQ